MFFGGSRKIRDHIEYTKTQAGTWRAEFNGTVHVAAEGRTLDECRHQIHEALDARIAELLLGRPLTDAERKL